MLVPSPVVAALLRRLRAGGDGWRIAAHDLDVDPLALARSGSRLVPFAAYFGGEHGTRIGGLGVAARWSATGADRLERLSAMVREAGPGDVPVLTGFAFGNETPRDEEWDGFAPATAVLPEITVVRDRGRGRIMVAVPPGRDPGRVEELLQMLETMPATRLPEAAVHVVESDPSPAAWREKVAEAVAAIRSGDMDKVVLARSVVISAEAVSDGFGLVARLRDRYPESFAFGWQEGDGLFVGASPELLVAVTADRVRSHPHAGSARRGGDDEEDRSLGMALMSSAKDRSEHQMVVEDVVARLRGVAGAIAAADTPALRRMANVQHLATLVTGTRLAERSVLEYAAALHPTPAVGGTPRPEALAYIDKLEGVDRGWYAGGIGWMGSDGGGEVAVSVRCGLLRGARARIFAGNGIVAGSDPDAELAETRLKLRPLLDLLATT